MTLTLRSRLTLFHTAVFALLLTAIAVVSYRVLAYQLDADLTATLHERTSGLHGYLRVVSGAPTVVFDASDPAEAAFVDEATRYYQVFDLSSGQLLAQSAALTPLGLSFTPEEVRQFRRRLATFEVTTDYGRVRLSNSLLTAGPGATYLVQVGVSLASMDRVLDRFLTLLLISVPAALLAAWGAGRWMTAVALRPLAHLANATRTIEVSDLRRRVPVRGARDELDDVAGAFNDTLERLEHAVGDMRQFSAALAHELRTPLAALRGEIELALRQSESGAPVRSRLVSQLEELDKLKRLIDQTLVLARAEAGEISLAAVPVDLGALTASLVDDLELVAEMKQVHLTCEHDEHVVVQGDPDWLKRLILNLVDNGIKFVPAGGRVTARVRQDGSHARLEVQDDGPGIDPAALARVFDRFFRADPARSPELEGAGLGLSLAKWIVERHNGRIQVRSDLGRGATFAVELPLAGGAHGLRINRI
jgi:heavy metal sensor kinase